MKITVNFRNECEAVHRRFLFMDELTDMKTFCTTWDCNSCLDMLMLMLRIKVGSPETAQRAILAQGCEPDVNSCQCCNKSWFLLRTSNQNSVKCRFVTLVTSVEWLVHGRCRNSLDPRGSWPFDLVSNTAYHNLLPPIYHLYIIVLLSREKGPADSVMSHFFLLIILSL